MLSIDNLQAAKLISLFKSPADRWIAAKEYFQITNMPESDMQDFRALANVMLEPSANDNGKLTVKRTT